MSVLRSAPMILVAVAFIASASDAPCYTTSSPEVDTCSLAGTGVGPGVHPSCTYVDSDPCQPDCIYSVWIYREYNGIPGLQRGDDVRNDVAGCDGQVEPDGFEF